MTMLARMFLAAEVMGRPLPPLRSLASHQHQRALNIFVDLLQIWFGAFDQEFAEVFAAVRHNRDGVGDIEDHQRLVDMPFGR